VGGTPILLVAGIWVTWSIKALAIAKSCAAAPDAGAVGRVSPKRRAFLGLNQRFLSFCPETPLELLSSV